MEKNMAIGYNRALLRGLWGIMENQMEKIIENDMEAGNIFIEPWSPEPQTLNPGTLGTLNYRPLLYLDTQIK